MPAVGDVQPLAKHPAKFSPPVLDVLERMLIAEGRRVCGRRKDPGWRPLEVLDPMAGVGRIHRLHRDGVIHTTGVELQPRWAACHDRTICADFFQWAPEPGNYCRWDVVATSPTYGNRFSDHHNARDGSSRRSYQHDYGEPLEPNNSGLLPWGPKYWAFHAQFYRWVGYVLRPGGKLFLNVSNFYKGDQLVHAVEWHRGAAMGAGLEHAGRDRIVATDRLQGVGTEATAKRAEHEVILQFRKQPDPWE